MRKGKKVLKRKIKRERERGKMCVRGGEKDREREGGRETDRQTEKRKKGQSLRNQDSSWSIGVIFKIRGHLISSHSFSKRNVFHIGVTPPPSEHKSHFFLMPEYWSLWPQKQ